MFSTSCSKFPTFLSCRGLLEPWWAHFHKLGHNFYMLFTIPESPRSKWSCSPKQFVAYNPAISGGIPSLLKCGEPHPLIAGSCRSRRWPVGFPRSQPIGKNPHKWRCLAKKIIYKWAICTMAILNNQGVYIKLYIYKLYVYTYTCICTCFLVGGCWWFKHMWKVSANFRHHDPNGLWFLQLVTGRVPRYHGARLSCWRACDRRFLNTLWLWCLGAAENHPKHFWLKWFSL